MNRRHTKRDLARLFKERGLRANRLLGQNFLVDHNILDGICKSGEVSASDAVLEIGAGTGMLTWHLAQTGAAVVAVEIDRSLFEIASEYLAGAANVHLVLGDIHGVRRRLNPAVEAAVEQVLAPGRTFKVVSNLPYCISSELLVSLLELRWRVERMVLTVQTEFADRLAAGPGTRDYSALTVLIGARARVRRLKNLDPAVFWPVPNVGSSIIRIDPEPNRASEIADYGLFKAVLAALFAQRRKTAATALKGMARPKLAKDHIVTALDSAGIPPGARADALSPAQIVALSNVLAREQQ